MKRISTIISFALLLSLTTQTSHAETVVEGLVGGGYQGNLFNDSNLTSDQYATFGMTITHYPSGSAQLSGTGRYNKFADYSDLSNFTGEFSGMVIPTSENSPLTLALSGSVATQSFGLLYQLYDQTSARAGLELDYALTQRVHARLSGSYDNNDYRNSDYGSNRNLDLSAGLATTIGSANSVVLRFDFSHRSFDQPAVNGSPGNLTLTSGKETTETFDATGALIRFSRPLGERTGINLSAGMRTLHFDHDLTVLGYTIDYLSPWADLWEGGSVSVGLKHFFPSQLILELSGAYYDKQFVDVVELSDVSNETYWQDGREDKLATAGLSLARPITLKAGGMLTPSVFVGYRNNVSTADQFDYDNFNGSFSLKVEF